ncbi:hypothetical protein [uncultured Campylobacter sp.]|uniref:hypothetical protein n=1 Tax=uncultured Campylobacter sp. TaxID=218934 RepID=UPI002627DDC4|nr:hypothetical protein [uncultured Campylobacter sp.]
MPRRKYGTKVYNHYIDGTYVFVGLCFVFYQILSSVFSYFPLMLGFFFCYMFYLLQESEKSLYNLDFRWYFSLCYLLLIDITHDFYLFSSWFSFFIFYYFLADWLKINFKIGKFLPIIFVFCAYFLLFSIDNLLSYVDNNGIHLFGIELLITVFMEFILAYIFFKDSIK